MLKPPSEDHPSGTAGPAGEHPFGDTGQIILLLVYLAVWVLDSFVFKYSVFLGRYVPFPFRALVALLVLVAAILLANSGHRAVHHGHHTEPRLIKDGAFAQVRHPLYLASLLFYLFLFCMTLSLISLGVFLGCFLFYDFIAAYEEKLLLKRFGQEYRDYKRQVPRWIPRFRAASPALTRSGGNPPDRSGRL